MFEDISASDGKPFKISRDLIDVEIPIKRKVIKEKTILQCRGGNCKTNRYKRVEVQEDE